MNKSWIDSFKIGGLLFLFVFGIPLAGFPLNTAKIAVILLSIGVIRRRSAREALGRLVRSKINLFILFVLCFLTVYSAWWPTVKGTGDFELSYVYLIFILERFVGSILFVAYAWSLEFELEDCINAIICVLVIQVIIIIAMFLSPSLRETLWAINARSNLEELSARYGGIRGLGLAGGVAYTMSVLLSVGVLLSAYASSQFGPRWWYVVGSILLVIGVFFSGRTGWFGIGLAGVFYAYANNLHQYLLTIRGVLLKLIPGIGLLVTVIYYYLEPETIDTITQTLIPFAFELFINLFERGELTASSFEATQSMYFPVSESTFWFGDGRWVSLPGKPYDYYMRTDAGYMRHMLFYGAIISFIFYLAYAVLFYYDIRNGSKLWGRKFGVLIGALMVYFFVVHWKGAFLAGANMNTKVLLVMHNIIVLAGSSQFIMHCQTNRKEASTHEL
jgi:hypothetical protein